MLFLFKVRRTLSLADFSVTEITTQISRTVIYPRARIPDVRATNSD